MNEPTRTAWQADRAGDREEHPFRIDPTRPIRLAVHNPNGDVSVHVVDRPDVLVRYERHGGRREAGLDDAAVTIMADGNEIDVRVDLPGRGNRKRVEVDLDLDLDLGDFNPFKGGGGGTQGAPGRAFAEAGKAIAQVGRALAGNWGDVRFDIEVELPGGTAESRVAVVTASGDVAVEGVAGAVSASTASGDVRAAALRGELTFRTASGDLRAEGLAGRVTARSASGDAHVTGSALEEFAFQSASGDITLGASLAGAGASRVQTVSGNVRLGLAAPSGGAPDATVTLKTVSGDANVVAPFRKTDRRAWQAGAGTHRIAVQTVSGDLHLAGGTAVSPTVGAHAARRFDPAPAAAPTPSRAAAPTPPTPPTPPQPPAPPLPAAPAPAAQKTGMESGILIETGTPEPHPDRSMAEGEPAPRPAAARGEDARRLAVLGAVERGEIDVEEALRRLDAVDPPGQP